MSLSIATELHQVVRTKLSRRFSFEQIVASLKQAELGMAISNLTGQTGISDQTLLGSRRDDADRVHHENGFASENTELNMLRASASRARSSASK